MIGKIAFYIVAVFCMVAFSPSVSYANGDGDCPYSKKGHKSEGFWHRLTGKDDGKNGHRHKKCHQKQGKSYGWSAKKPDTHVFWWRSSSMAERLRLDEEQVARMDEISDSYHERMRESHNKAVETKWEFQKLMKNPGSSADQIKAAAENMYIAQTEKSLLKLEKKLAMRETLRPEQIEDLSVLKRKGHKKKCGSGKGHR